MLSENIVSNSELEQRMVELEKEMASLRAKIDAIPASAPWWERIAGTFHNDPAYRQAMDLGKQYRLAQTVEGPNAAQ